VVVHRTAWPEEEVQCTGHQGLHIVEGSQEVFPHRLQGPLHKPGAGHHKRVVGLHNLRKVEREDMTNFTFGNVRQQKEAECFAVTHGTLLYAAEYTQHRSSD
jgi:hypothetical protein